MRNKMARQAEKNMKLEKSRIQARTEERIKQQSQSSYFSKNGYFDRNTIRGLLSDVIYLKTQNFKLGKKKNSYTRNVRDKRGFYLPYNVESVSNIIEQIKE